MHDGEYGAYLDAMGDKAFGVTALVALALQPGVVSTLPYWFVAISALKLPLHVALAVTRTQVPPTRPLTLTLTLLTPTLTLTLILTLP